MLLIIEKHSKPIDEATTINTQYYVKQNNRVKKYRHTEYCRTGYFRGHDNFADFIKTAKLSCP